MNAAIPFQLSLSPDGAEEEFVLKIRATQAIMECLLEQDVDTIFGYPGGTILNLYDELYRYQGKIRHILTAHEQGAAHAADGYARSTGKVGVCFATSGPGATNITSEIFKAACRAFDEAWDGQTPLRQLGVQMTKLTQEPYQQYDLFSDLSPVRYERKLRLDETVDALRDKFGETIIRRAKFSREPDAHMTGGLDKARRTGVTKPVPKEFD